MVDEEVDSPSRPPRRRHQDPGEDVSRASSVRDRSALEQQRKERERQRAREREQRERERKERERERAQRQRERERAPGPASESESRALRESREWARDREKEEQRRRGGQPTRDWQRDFSRNEWDGEPRRGSAVAARGDHDGDRTTPLRTATPRRGTGKPTDSSEIERALFTGGMKEERKHPVLVESSPAAVAYMEQENATLQRRKEASDRRLHSMAPRQASPGQPEARTTIENQLEREQLILESQLQRMEMERDSLLVRNPNDNGSEPRYAQLNHRIGKVTEDLRRVDKELQTVRRIEKRGAVSDY